MNNLTPKQLKAIPLMAQGMMGVEVAKEISVAPQTISEWRKSFEFMAELNDYRFQLLENARSQLQYAPSKAVQTLYDLMENSESDETKRKAAIDILRLNGFEPGKYDSFGLGIGARDKDKIEYQEYMNNFAFS